PHPPPLLCPYTTLFRSGLAVEGRDLASQRANQIDAHLSTQETLFERGLCGQSLHLHGPFDHLAAAIHPEPRAAVRYGYDSKVNVDRKSTRLNSSHVSIS